MLLSQTFSFEIWLLIFETLDQQSLKAFAEVSRGMNSLATPVLYANIDLSIHHITPQITLEDGRVVSRWPIDVQKILGRQNLFMQQILERPDNARWVRSFTWTMSLHHLCELPEWASRAMQRLEDVYTMFQRLCHATYVDIDGGDCHNYPCPSLIALFPKATEIHLRGQMHYALASAILHGPNKSPLEHLDLRNVLERGRFHTGQNFQPRYDHRFKIRPPLLPLVEDWPEHGLPVQVAPGEMTRLLGPALQSRCHRLVTFTFGVLDLSGEFRHRMLPPGWHFRVATIDGELAAFFQHIHPNEVNLLYFCLSPERRADLKSRYWRRKCILSPQASSYPHKALLDTLLKGWPELKLLRIHGGRRIDARVPTRSHSESVVDLPPASQGNTTICFDPEKWEFFRGALCTTDTVG